MWEQANHMQVIDICCWHFENCVNRRTSWTRVWTLWSQRFASFELESSQVTKIFHSFKKLKTKNRSTSFQLSITLRCWESREDFRGDNNHGKDWSSLWFSHSLHSQCHLNQKGRHHRWYNPGCETGKGGGGVEGRNLGAWHQQQVCPLHLLSACHQ